MEAGVRVWSDMADSSDRSLTVTVIARVSDIAFGAPLSSVAVTVIVAVPAETPASVSSVPSSDTSTVATPGSSDSAVSVCV